MTGWRSHHRISLSRTLSRTGWPMGSTADRRARSPSARISARRTSCPRWAPGNCVNSRRPMWIGGVDALREHQGRLGVSEPDPGGIVFVTSRATAMAAGNVRRTFRLVVKAAGLNPEDWTPRELRHSFVSILSDDGVPLGDIADLCGHAGSVTEKVYRHQLRPLLLRGLSRWTGSSRRLWMAAGGSEPW
jgi:hypothetical protein